MSKYGQSNNYQRKPSQPKEYKKPENSTAEDKPQAAKAVTFESPDETIHPPYNIQIKEGDEYNYVTTIYPYFKKNGMVGYRTSKNSNVNFFVEDAKLIQEKQEDGTFKTVGVVTSMLSKSGKIMWVPDTLSPSSFFMTTKKPRE